MITQEYGDDLVIGQRYWLDRVADISAVYNGQDDRGNHVFGEAVGNYTYLTNEDGTITMGPSGKNYFKVKQ